MDTHGEKTGIFAKKGLWIGVGTALFILIAFILPTPESLVEVMEKYGYVEKMIDWEIAHNAKEAAAKTMIVLGIVPMAVCRRGSPDRGNGHPDAADGLLFRAAAVQHDRQNLCR
jgi:hypothetical protein